MTSAMPANASNQQNDEPHSAFIVSRPVDTIPERPGFWTLLTAIHSPGVRWPGATRAALAMALPGIIALLFGFDNEMLLILSGSYAVIYGEGHPFRTRWRVILIAGLLSMLAVASGSFIGTYMWNELNAGGSTWWLLLSASYATIICVIGAFVQNALRLPPPGSFFIIMAGCGSTMVARLGINPLEVAGWAGLGVIFSIILGMAPALIDKRKPQTRIVEILERSVEDVVAAPNSMNKMHQAETALATTWSILDDAGIVVNGRYIGKDSREENADRTSDAQLVRRTLLAQHRLASSALFHSFNAYEDLPLNVEDYEHVDLACVSMPLARPSIAYRFYRSAHKYSHPSITAGKILIACILTGIFSVAIGLERPDWGVLSVLLILQWGPDRIPGTIRATHRVVGSALGILVFAGFSVLGIHGWSLLLVISCLQFFAEIFIPRNYAIGVIATTPLALLSGGTATGQLITIAENRGIEMILAALFSILLLWAWMPNGEVAHHDRLIQRCYSAIGNVLGALLMKTTNEAMRERRDLQYELLAEGRAAQSLSHNQPKAALADWQLHLMLQHVGYTLLDYCAAHSAEDNERLTMKQIEFLSTLIRESQEEFSQPSPPTPTHKTNA